MHAVVISIVADVIISFKSGLIFIIDFINPSKTSGSITYSNSNNNLIIQSSKMLGFQKVYDLQLVNSNWNFKLLLSESNLRDEETISIDIELNGVNKKAECTNNENLLTLKT